MHNFEGVRVCPKCGARRFVGELRTETANRTYCPTVTVGDVTNIRTIEEHLEVECGRCKYTWKERCADWKPGEEDDDS